MTNGGDKPAAVLPFARVRWSDGNISELSSPELWYAFCALTRDTPCDRGDRAGGGCVVEFDDRKILRFETTRMLVEYATVVADHIEEIARAGNLVFEDEAISN